MAASASLRRLCFFQPRGCFHSPTCVCSPLCSFVKAALLAVLPIAIWLLLFCCAQFIPETWRPSISVDVLPALDELLFDSSIGLLSFSAVLVAAGWLVTGSHMATFLVFVPLTLRGLRDLAAVPSTVADVLAFLPYGVLHYVSPAVFAIWLWWYAGVKSAVVFAQAFGVQNSMGVLTQLIFPTAAPWYNDLYGFAPASYSMPGHPGGLARIDKLFGTHMYQSAFNNSPLVFGAMPSLHSGFAVLIMLFAMHFSRRLGALLMVYMCWQWWATIYLRHHYMIDLFVGAFYSSITYFLARRYLVRASAGMGLAGLVGMGEYKLLDAVVVLGGDSMEAANGGAPKSAVTESSGWAEAILKSRRAVGEREPLVMSSVPLEGVIIDGRGDQ